MQTFDANEVATALPYARLIDALDEAFAGNIHVPLRAHHDVPVPGGNDATLLLMPAWQSGKSIGVKIASVFPDNARHSLPAVFASYFLMSGETGEPIAVLDGTELTVRRTAAASALASRYLSRQDAATLLMVGTGNLAPHLIRAHATVRPIERVIIWGRREASADDLAGRLANDAFSVEVSTDLGAAISAADVISCATLASDPLVRGERLVEGQHVDLVGAFRPDMREADDNAIARASVWVDTIDGATSEAGEIVQAIRNGVLAADDIKGELSDLATGAAGRGNASEITLFKSVGTALEDLAAAELAVETLTG